RKRKSGRSQAGATQPSLLQRQSAKLTQSPTTRAPRSTSAMRAQRSGWESCGKANTIFRRCSTMVTFQMHRAWQRGFRNNVDTICHRF
ncbi:hypothetical protein IW150_005311, partial [Coemansia sp. RSA 2607]